MKKPSFMSESGFNIWYLILVVLFINTAFISQTWIQRIIILGLFLIGTILSTYSKIQYAMIEQEETRESNKKACEDYHGGLIAQKKLSK